MALTSRRSLLAGAAGLALASALPGCRDTRPGIPPRVAGAGPFAGGDYLGDVAFTGERDRVIGTLDKEGLDGRLRVDLAALTPAALLVPPDQFYVRTRPPELPSSWPIELDGLVDTPTAVDAAEIAAAARDQGTHLMECSGNGRGERWGLMSPCAWRGVPLTEVLERAAPRRDGTRVLVRGRDHAERSEGASHPGCSWVFSWADLDRTGAFLATEMGGAPLLPVHGAPVRLMVPGWFGCTSPKWVDRIEVVADDTAATAQMREFASRTHQTGIPELARDYAAPFIELAALPIRVEEWRVAGQRRFRVWGIAWGGERPADKLQIRFKKSERWVAVTSWSPPSDTRSWSLWWHDWEPSGGGDYEIQVRSPDPKLGQRRLKKGWYNRKLSV